MKLKINEEKLSIESMKKIIEMVDSGVLVDTGKELTKESYKLKNAVWTEEKERKLMLLKNRGVKRRDIASQLGMTARQITDKINSLKAAGKLDKLKIKVAKNPYFTKEMRDLLLQLKDKKSNTSYPKIVERLNKKFGKNLTVRQVKEKYKTIKEW